jgi:hypothetical protein
VPAPEKAFARPAFFGYFAGVGRRSRGAGLQLTAAERESLVQQGVAAPDVWSLADLARAALLQRACKQLPDAEHVGLLHEAYRKGDNGERIAVLRALVLMPQPERFVEIANESCRTHVLDVFAAIACENAYPERYFDELHWNQLVMKAVFLDLRLARIVGLQARNNAPLARMASDFAAERRAAGRVVPEDLSLVTPGT